MENNNKEGNFQAINTIFNQNLIKYEVKKFIENRIAPKIIIPKKQVEAIDATNISATNRIF